MDLFFDESKHPVRGFNIGAFVVSDADPTEAVHAALARRGLLPNVDEFKSSTRMGDNPEIRKLRNDLGRIVRQSCQLAVVVAPNESDLAAEALRLLKKILQHPALVSGLHRVFFDEGLVKSVRHGTAMVERSTEFAHCAFRFEENSKTVAGIQLADMVAHTCSIMLAESLGLFHKTVRAGANSGYDPDLEIPLGFELWAGIRMSFLSAPPPHPDKWLADEFQPTADVKPYGLHISDAAERVLRDAAEERFGSMYLGCIH